MAKQLSKNIADLITFNLIKSKNRFTCLQVVLVVVAAVAALVVVVAVALPQALFQDLTSLAQL